MSAEEFDANMLVAAELLFRAFLIYGVWCLDRCRWYLKQLHHIEC